MNKILMISTGGTLASSHSDNGLSPGLHGNDVLDRIRGLTVGFQVEEEELFMLDSSNVQPEEWTKIARTVYERRHEYDGIVIIHGTDTLAYTASALSFALQNIEIPVVLTGSQVSIENPIADATENCRAALHMAASHCPGVYVEAFGIGGLPFEKRNLTESVREAIKEGMVIAVGSQCLYEGSDFSVYEVGRQVLDCGVIETGNMTSEAAVTKLMWALGQYEDKSMVEKIMKTNLLGELGSTVDWNY